MLHTSFRVQRYKERIATGLQSDDGIQQSSRPCQVSFYLAEPAHTFVVVTLQQSFSCCYPLTNLLLGYPYNYIIYTILFFIRQFEALEFQRSGKLYSERTEIATRHELIADTLGLIFGNQLGPGNTTLGTRLVKEVNYCATE